MKKYIVPAKQTVLAWKSFFEEAFSDEESLNEAMQMFASMMTAFIMDSQFNNDKFSPFVAAFERCLELAEGYEDIGQLGIENTVDLAELAYNFIIGLTAYLKDVGVLKTPSTIKFEGFVGMDFIISIVEHDEKVLSEDICQSG